MSHHYVFGMLIAEPYAKWAVHACINTFVMHNICI
jgi:hypothetical protein